MLKLVLAIVYILIILFLLFLCSYIKKLEEAVKGKREVDLKSEDNQLKLTALRTTSNISTLIRDLFHSPPSFKHEIKLSWVAVRNVSTSIYNYHQRYYTTLRLFLLLILISSRTALLINRCKFFLFSLIQNKLGVKRHAPITFEGRNESNREDEKRNKVTIDQKIYLPPSGKYSAKVQNYHKTNNGNNNANNRARPRPVGGRGNGGNGVNGSGASVPYIRNRRYFRKY